jgi:riboflavin synthase
MFTGIIEHTGTVESLDLHPEGGRLTIGAPDIAPALSVANSIAVNGCCLTVVACDSQHFAADLSGETIRRTSFGELKPGACVNLERPLTATKEFGGHFVQGHVDGIGRAVHLKPEGANWWWGVRVPEELGRYVAMKGSIALDGISLTVAGWHDQIVEIAVIPFTYGQTNLCHLKPGDAVNIECDILAKYVERLMEARSAPGADASPLTLGRLTEQGF